MIGPHEGAGPVVDIYAREDEEEGEAGLGREGSRTPGENGEKLRLPTACSKGQLPQER